MKPSEVLRKARATIQEQRAVTLAEVMPVLRRVTDYTDEYRAIIRCLHDACGSALATWFDKCERALGDVLDLFDRAIAAAEARGE